MRGNVVNKIILCAMFAVPTDNLNGWTQLQFSKIPANVVNLDEGKISLEVKSSASPLIYKLSEIQDVKNFSVSIDVDGAVKQSNEEKVSEDYVFRLGLVAVGDKTLSRFQRLLAADWVKKLFDLSPKGVGLDKIYFYNIASSSKQVGNYRVHPKTELMSEKIIAEVSKEGTYFYELEKPLKIAAIWISSDGDDSKSEFKVKIKKINFNQ
jgi:hypothetical protein